MTFAEIDAAFEAVKLDAWDRAAFVAEHAFNANPFLKKPVEVSNPYRPNYRRVSLEDVPGLD